MSADKEPVDKPIELTQKEIDQLEALTKDISNDFTMPEDTWEKLVKQLKLYNILHDIETNIFEHYCADYNKKNTEESPLELKLKLTKRKHQKTGHIASVALQLEMKRRGLRTTLSEQHIEFRHVREMTDAASWKYALYEAMLKDLIYHGLTSVLLMSDVKSGTIK